MRGTRAGRTRSTPCAWPKLLTQVWILDVDDTKVLIVVKSNPNTPAADLAAAQAIVDSIRIERPPTGADRLLTFTLPARWDSG